MKNNITLPFITVLLIAIFIILAVIAIFNNVFHSALQTRILANGQQQIVLSAADNHTSDYPTVLALKKMATILEHESHHTMTIHVYSGSQLGSEQDTLEQTLFGALNIDRVSLNALNHIAPDTVVFSLPYIFDSIDSMHKIVDGSIGQQVLSSLKPEGYIGLAFYDSGARSFYNTKHPIYTPSDLKGLKLRVQASDVAVAMIKALGANPTTMDFGEVYDALKLGDIDGAENNVPSFYSTKHYTIAKYYSEDRHTIVPEIVLMSARTWRALTPQQRQWVMTAARQSVPYMRQQWQQMTEQSLQKLQQAGVKINQIQHLKQWQQKAGAIYPKFVTTPQLQHLVDAIDQAQGERVK